MFGHLNQCYEWSNWSQPKKNYSFRTFQLLGSWLIGFWVITGFLQLLRSLGSLVFYFFLVSISFAYTSRNPVSMGLRANTSEKNPKPIYEIKCTSDLCEWLLQLVTQWSVGAPKLICLCINFSHYLDQRISDPFFQTNSP